MADAFTEVSNPVDGLPSVMKGRYCRRGSQIKAHYKKTREGVIISNCPNSNDQSGRGILTDLAERQCVPCRGGVPPLAGEEITKLASQVEGWQVINDHHLQKTYSFKDFREALDFVNRVGQLAEEQGHHPDICFGWGKADVSIWTHKIDGLTESDFVLAAKIDRL